MPTLQELLASAVSARHALLTGTAAARVRDSNGEEIVYTMANLTKLREYIAELQAEIAAAAGTAVDNGPMRVFL